MDAQRNPARMSGLPFASHHFTSDSPASDFHRLFEFLGSLHPRWDFDPGSFFCIRRAAPSKERSLVEPAQVTSRFRQSRCAFRADAGFFLSLVKSAGSTVLLRCSSQVRSQRLLRDPHAPLIDLPATAQRLVTWPRAAREVFSPVR